MKKESDRTVALCEGVLEKDSSRDEADDVELKTSVSGPRSGAKEERGGLKIRADPI